MNTVRAEDMERFIGQLAAGDPKFGTNGENQALLKSCGTLVEIAYATAAKFRNRWIEQIAADLFAEFACTYVSWVECICDDDEWWAKQGNSGLGVGFPAQDGGIAFVVLRQTTDVEEEESVFTLDEVDASIVPASQVKRLRELIGELSKVIDLAHEILREQRLTDQTRHRLNRDLTWEHEPLDW